jgi:trans-feruloyl-CoA hydratase/vanillin synthase
MPPRQAMYYALTGEPFNGKRAAEVGLATMSVPKDKLKAEVRRIAEALREKDPIALKVTKEVLKVSLRMDYEEAYAYSVALGGDLTYKQDGAWMKSGIGEFMEGKSKPGLNESAKS